MEPASKLDNALLAQARSLVTELEAGNTAAAENLIDEFARQRDQSLYRELGRMTRQLHDALNGVPLDVSIRNLARTEFPDTRARLNHVITMTEDSANRTLNAVEDSMPVAAQIKSRAKDLYEKRGQLYNRKLNVDELNNDIDDFLCTTGRYANRIHDNLSEVLMAQEFQDLTGQILRRVISLVQEVEENLVQLIKTTGNEVEVECSGVIPTVNPAVGSQEKNRELKRGTGPQVPGIGETTDTVSGQDEVDDLLSSLGF